MLQVFLVKICITPFISSSDTGTIPPERCLFGIMLNISAFLGEYRKLSLATSRQFWNAHSFKQFNFLIQIIKQPIILSQTPNSKQLILILLSNSEESVC